MDDYERGYNQAHSLLDALRATDTTLLERCRERLESAAEKLCGGCMQYPRIGADHDYGDVLSPCYALAERELLTVLNLRLEANL